MGLTRVMALLASGQYDTLVLDSAATGHLIRLLELPETVDQWLKAFFDLFLKYPQVFRFTKFTQRLVEISKNLKRLKGLLSDPYGSAVYAVSIPTDMAFEETRDLLAACDRLGIGVAGLFLNLVTPPAIANCAPRCAAERLGWETSSARLFQARRSRWYIVKVKSGGSAGWLNWGRPFMQARGSNRRSMSIENGPRDAPPAIAGPSRDDHARVCLCEVLDRVLNKGVVVAGDLTISVADIDLIYLGLEVVLTSVETARDGLHRAPAGRVVNWTAGTEEPHGII